MIIPVITNRKGELTFSFSRLDNEAKAPQAPTLATPFQDLRWELGGGWGGGGGKKAFNPEDLIQGLRHLSLQESLQMCSMIQKASEKS